jgi:hypothetical protein
VAGLTPPPHEVVLCDENVEPEALIREQRESAATAPAMTER